MSATRLIFEYSGGQIRLVSSQNVRMIVHPSPGSPDVGSGMVAEVRATDGTILHRAAIKGAMEPHVEVFSDDPAQSIHRVPVEQPQGAFTVLVPDCREADHVALLADPSILPEGSVAAEGLRELIRVPLGRAEDSARP